MSILMVSSFFATFPVAKYHSLAIAFLDDLLPAPSGMVSTTCPTYPWPSFGVTVTASVPHMPAHTIKMFLTDLLFSSPRLRFSEQQKRAVLSWASQLGARDVPTYHALSRFQEHLRNTAGDSVTAVTTGAGHKVYMQDIPYMIAKVCLTSLWPIGTDPAGACRTMQILSLGLRYGTTPLTVKEALCKCFMGPRCLLTCHPTSWYPLYALTIAYFSQMSSSKHLVGLILSQITFSTDCQEAPICQVLPLPQDRVKAAMAPRCMSCLCTIYGCLAIKLCELMSAPLPLMLMAF
jgi:hypothetical protein